MPRCALPEHIDEPHEWDGKDDDDHWYTRWRKKVKHLFAFSSRCPSGVAFGLCPPWLFSRKWRKCPTVIFAIKGKGPWRIESLDGHQAQIEFPDRKFLFFPRLETSAASVMTTFYFSRVQYWTRWHFALQWPLFYSWHFYKKAEDVIPAGKK